MVFSSVIFLVFFLPVTIALYYAVPGKNGKNALLLAASLVFYAWGEPRYIFLMVASIVANYALGRLIYAAKRRGRRGGLLLGAALLVNLGMLVYFKYFGFLAEVAGHILHRTLTVKAVALPIGISFFTFQGLSYVIDVYRADPDQPVVQKNFIDLALYVAMFPQLIAGPIVRYHDIQPYLRGRVHSADRFARGVETFIFGLSKKVLIANVLGQTVESIMEKDASMISMPIAWLGALCYALQLYYDFLGYSEMAIGLGRMFGFEFQINFNYPYISTSVSEFWRRWHISLSQWFRDYLYIPMGGSRRGNVYFNLLVVFLATGIWHGAAYGFVIWGLWHGLFVILERFLRNHGAARFRVPKVVKWLYTMLVALLGWTLFRIVDLGDTLRYLSVMFGRTRYRYVRYTLEHYLSRRTVAVLVVGALCAIPWKEVLCARFPGLEQAAQRPWAVGLRRLFALGLLVVCYLFIANSSYNPFIYFRF